MRQKKPRKANRIRRQLYKNLYKLGFLTRLIKPVAPLQFIHSDVTVTEDGVYISTVTILQ